MTAVEFGGVPAASWERISELEIIAITPPHAAANMLEVTVTTAEDGKSEGLGCPPGKPKKCKGDTFTWGPLVVSSISPNNGPVAGGTLVHVRGQGLGSETEFKLGKFKATSVECPSQAECTFVTPKQKKPGVQIVLTNNGKKPKTKRSRGLPFTYEA